MQLNRGQRLALSTLTPSLNLRVEFALYGVQVDVACFGLDAQSHLADERYMIFYNQATSPCAGVALSNPAGGSSVGFDLILDRLPSSIDRLVFTAAIEEAGTMRQLQRGQVFLRANGSDLANFSLTGQDFDQERAVMLLEMYRKDGTWRISATGQGFNGGLAALVKHFGGEAAEETPAPTAPATVIAPQSAPAQTQNVAARVSIDKAVKLEKELQQKAPRLVNLSKKLAVTLEKHQLQEVTARVALVMDASGSMSQAYANGIVQAVIDRFTLVAARLDDDGALETWFYADKCRKFPNVTVNNVTGYIKKNVKAGLFEIVKGLGIGNNEPPVMHELLSYFKGSTLPALILFVTDGGIYEDQKIRKILIEASRYPIFWQFIGVAGAGYGILEELDTMTGRTVDNAGFFSVDDLHRISEEELYERLLKEFPQWLKEARQKGITF